MSTLKTYYIQSPDATGPQITLNPDSVQIEGFSGGGGGATGGGTDKVFYENDTVVTTSYTITENKNAVTGGPISINDDVVISVLDGSVWTVI
jgi:hypothetical protein